MKPTLKTFKPAENELSSIIRRFNNDYMSKCFIDSEACSLLDRSENGIESVSGISRLSEDIRSEFSGCRFRLGTKKYSYRFNPERNFLRIERTEKISSEGFQKLETAPEMFSISWRDYARKVIDMTRKGCFMYPFQKSYSFLALSLRKGRESNDGFMTCLDESTTEKEIQEMVLSFVGYCRLSRPLCKLLELNGCLSGEDAKNRFLMDRDFVSASFDIVSRDFSRYMMLERNMIDYSRSDGQKRRSKNAGQYIRMLTILLDRNRILEKMKVPCQLHDHIILDGKIYEVSDIRNRDIVLSGDVRDINVRYADLKSVSDRGLLTICKDSVPERTEFYEFVK